MKIMCYFAPPQVKYPNNIFHSMHVWACKPSLTFKYGSNGFQVPIRTSIICCAGLAQCTSDHMFIIINNFLRNELSCSKYLILVIHLLQVVFVSVVYLRCGNIFLWRLDPNLIWIWLWLCVCALNEHHISAASYQPTATIIQCPNNDLLNLENEMIHYEI